MRKRRGPEPVYKAIQNTIRRQIERGELIPGDVVNSERSLAKLHRVSLMTARHALGDLEREGLVERRHGAGTFVAPPKIHFNKLMSYTEQMAARGLNVRSRTIAAGIVKEHEIAARLGLPPASRLFHIERVRQAADEPFALEICYLSADEFPTLEGEALAKGSLFSTLEHEYRTNLAYADEEIDATDADAHAADLLGIERGSALLRMRQLIFSSSGRATVYVLGLYRSGRHTLLIRRFR